VSNPTPPEAFRLAVHEDLLPGSTDDERLGAAVAAGFGAVEFNGNKLAARVPDVNAALQAHGLVASSVHLGWDHDFLAADEATRQHALDALRGAMTDAVDIGAGTVVFVPQVGRELDLPDLMPFKSAMQVALELMVWHLRGYSDLAYVFEVQVLLHPVNRETSAFLNRLDQGAELLRRIKQHQHVRLAADAYHMLTTEPDPVASVTTQADLLELVYLVDNTGGLPGTGSTDFNALAAALPGKVGWAVVRGYHRDEPPTVAELSASRAHLETCGFRA
jgi:sugar phosphate isomerase/epimerase